MQFPNLNVTQLADSPNIRRKAIAILHRREFLEAYSYPTGGSPLQGRYRALRRSLAVRAIFSTLEEMGLVRLRIAPDESADLADLKGDCFDPSANPNIPPTRLKAEERALEERVERDGVWGLISEYRPNPDSNPDNRNSWHCADNCWGFGCDTDAMDSAIQQLADNLASPRLATMTTAAHLLGTSLALAEGERVILTPADSLFGGNQPPREDGQLQYFARPASGQWSDDQPHSTEDSILLVAEDVTLD
jgi:hypothetical protein